MNKKRNKLILNVLPVFLGVLFAFFMIPVEDQARETDRDLSVTFVDVGHGDAILVSNRGEHLLIDTGEAPGTDRLMEVLEERGISRLDWLMITHEHSDHIGGVMQVMNKLDVDYILHSIEDPQTDMKRIGRRAIQSGTEVMQVHPGDAFPVGDALATVVGPYTHEGDENNSSVLLRVDYGDTSFLFMGDAEEDEERELLDAGYDISADVLKVGHHGGETSTTPELLEAVEPEYAVISCAEDEAEYPAQSVLDRLADYVEEVFITGRDGDITFLSDGEEVGAVVN